MILYFSLRSAERFNLDEISRVALISDSALPSVNAFELTKAWYSLCSLANSALENYFLIKLIAAESLPDTVSDAT